MKTRKLLGEQIEITLRTKHVLINFIDAFGSKLEFIVAVGPSIQSSKAETATIQIICRGLTNKKC